MIIIRQFRIVYFLLIFLFFIDFFVFSVFLFLLAINSSGDWCVDEFERWEIQFNELMELDDLVLRQYLGGEGINEDEDEDEDDVGRWDQYREWKEYFIEFIETSELIWFPKHTKVRIKLVWQWFWRSGFDHAWWDKVQTYALMEDDVPEAYGLLQTQLSNQVLVRGIPGSFKTLSEKHIFSEVLKSVDLVDSNASFRVTKRLDRKQKYFPIRSYWKIKDSQKRVSGITPFRYFMSDPTHYYAKKSKLLDTMIIKKKFIETYRRTRKSLKHERLWTVSRSCSRKRKRK